MRVCSFVYSLEPKCSRIFHAHRKFKRAKIRMRFCGDVYKAAKEIAQIPVMFIFMGATVSESYSHGSV